MIELETGREDLPVFSIAKLRRSLLGWYQAQGRFLPWREHTNPYPIWVSEVMLQQTGVNTVIPYYQRWMAQFPTIDSLAHSDLQTVLKAWEGLGYYARARHLHQSAQQIIQQGGEFPTQLAEVMSLPGIGRTTAGAILSLLKTAAGASSGRILSAAFNQPISILDGNVKRVLSRLVVLEVPPAKATKQLWRLSDALVDPHQPRDFNQALMDLGATVCTPRHPNCSHCPWQRECQGYNKGIQSQLPMRETSSPLPHKKIGVAVILNEQGQILIDRRPAKGLLGGLWEFPGGKIEPDETVEECIKREINEELAIDVEVGDHLITIDHVYSHFRVTLTVHYCRHLDGEPQPIECDEIRWVTLAEIDQFPFPKANSQIIAALRRVDSHHV